ncbi:MAG TPA: aspartate/glutamate racemase family protein [Candidatus Limnocylindrales bacterium]|nr:aspartate/glutamate racemase family protein [Candidatus Limnocylindrales bacterium]
MTRVALVHTVGSLVPVFRELSAELLPGVDTTDVVDEALLGETIAAGRIRDETAKRLESHVRDAVEAGSDLVLVTCSSVGPAVEAIRERTGWPVLRVDEAMADRALELGARIGVVATLSTTLEPTADLIRRRGGNRGVEVATHLCEGAFDALKAGDVEGHDAAVRAGILALVPRVDVIVLAQASMARVAAALRDETADTPILASPRLGMERVAELVGAAAGP